MAFNSSQKTNSVAPSVEGMKEGCACFINVPFLNTDCEKFHDLEFDYVRNYVLRMIASFVLCVFCLKDLDVKEIGLFLSSSS